ncbi:uncharacterized protein LOC128554670 [Mercenaria mercenaria]|uniref:uncharacterized protein LOC128554670 n=1 Tax=Mercenaria mercenaria TaxID=6596 RepID=UPI00234F2B6E|nr:uncharacterized protein LOC128554670 [Mercenaria mercenaria]
MRSATKNPRQLRKDILNSVYHILGFHKLCSDFCQKRPEKDSSTDENIIDDDTFESTFDDIFEEQYKYWQIPSEAEMEESRRAISNSNSLIELKEMIADVQVILNRVADKSERLIGNFTTNLAESWMAIRSKFDGGKVINRCGRGSCNTRCYGGALRKNLGIAWSPLTFQTVTRTLAGVYFHQGARKQAQKRTASMKYKSKPDSKNIRRKRKLHSLKESCSKKAKFHYGSQLNDAPDVPADKLSGICQRFYEMRVHKNETEIADLQKNTVDQSASQLWKKERHIRLTSSNFGKVMKRRTSNVSDNIVKNMLYTQFRGNMFTIRGLEQEANTIIEYKNQKKDVSVEKVGLQICSSLPFLAASTDGLITDEDESGLLEIKNFLQTNK